VLLAALALLLVTAAPASANNDPHRFYSGAGPFDFVGQCTFTVHFEPLTDKEYESVRTAPDGSMTAAVTGAMKVRLTNATTGKALDYNVSGPSVAYISPDGDTITGVARGQSLIYGWNLPAWGFPSNLILTSGLFSDTVQVQTDGTVLVTDVAHYPAHVTDVCAALS
jgi:WD40 repeat protein